MYSPTALTNAYKMVKVKKASRIFQVPDTILRDRALQNVNPETAVFEMSPVSECFEEANLV